MADRQQSDSLGTTNAQKPTPIPAQPYGPGGILGLSSTNASPPAATDPPAPVADPFGAALDRMLAAAAATSQAGQQAQPAFDISNLLGSTGPDATAAPQPGVNAPAVPLGAEAAASGWGASPGEAQADLTARSQPVADQSATTVPVTSQPLTSGSAPSAPASVPIQDMDPRFAMVRRAITGEAAPTATPSAMDYLAPGAITAALSGQPPAAATSAIPAPLNQLALPAMVAPGTPQAMAPDGPGMDPVPPPPAPPTSSVTNVRPGNIGQTGLPDVALPTFQAVPDAPAPLPVAPAPQQDLAARRNAELRALAYTAGPLLAANVIQSIFGNHKGGQAMSALDYLAPGMISKVITGTGQGNDEQYARQVQNYREQQAAQQVEDTRRQEAYKQQVAQVTAMNGQEQQKFQDASELRQQDVMALWRQGQVANGANRNLNVTRAQITGMDPISQEQFLQSNPDIATQLGMPLQRAPDGTYLPYLSNKDDNAATTAAARGTQAGAAVTRAGAAVTNAAANTSRAATYSQAVKNLQNHYNVDAQIAQQVVTNRAQRDKVSEAVAAERVGQGWDRLQVQHDALGLASQRIQGAASLGPRNPVGALFNLNKSLATARIGRQKAVDAVGAATDPSEKAEMSAVVNNYDQAIADGEDYAGKLRAYVNPKGPAARGGGAASAGNSAGATQTTGGRPAAAAAAAPAPTGGQQRDYTGLSPAQLHALPPDQQRIARSQLVGQMVGQ